MTGRHTPFLVSVRPGRGGAVRFDHVVIAVPALPPAAGTFRDAGFDVVPGGRHEGHGTHNAIVLLEGGYLELIAREDLTAPPAGPFASDVAEIVAREGGGFAGWALAHDGDPAALAAIAAGAGGELPAANPMSRVRGSRTVRWDLRFADRAGFLGPLPFFIRWDGAAPHEQARPAHANGAVSLDRVVLLVADRRAAAWYEQALGPAPGADVRVHPAAPGTPPPPHGGRVAEVVLRGTGPPLTLALDPAATGSAVLRLTGG